MFTHREGSSKEILVVEADGLLNSQEAGNLLRDIEKQTEAGLQRVVVNCDRIDYLSTPGISTLVRLHCKLKKHGGRLALCGVKQLINDMFHTTRLDRLFEIYPDEAKAEAALAAR